MSHQAEDELVAEILSLARVVNQQRTGVEINLRCAPSGIGVQHSLAVHRGNELRTDEHLHACNYNLIEILITMRDLVVSVIEELEQEDKA